MDRHWTVMIRRLASAAVVKDSLIPESVDNKLVDEWASVALAQFDAEVRFSVRASKGNPTRGLELLDKADQVAQRPGRATKRRLKGN